MWQYDLIENYRKHYVYQTPNDKMNMNMNMKYFKELKSRISFVFIRCFFLRFKRTINYTRFVRHSKILTQNCIAVVVCAFIITFSDHDLVEVNPCDLETIDICNCTHMKMMHAFCFTPTWLSSFMLLLLTIKTISRSEVLQLYKHKHAILFFCAFECINVCIDCKFL